MNAFFRVISDQASWIVYFSHEANKKNVVFFCTFAFAFYCHYTAWWVCEYKSMHILRLTTSIRLCNLFLDTVVFFSAHSTSHWSMDQHTSNHYHCIRYSHYSGNIHLTLLFCLCSGCWLFHCCCWCCCCCIVVIAVIVVVIFFTFRILSFSPFAASPVDLCTTHVFCSRISFLASFRSFFVLPIV